MNKLSFRDCPERSEGGMRGQYEKEKIMNY